MTAPAGGASSEVPLLRLRAVEKSYAAPVLRGVDLELRRGEVHALVGANGAGKSTLVHIVGGLTPVDGGQMELEGEAYAPGSRRQAAAAGVVLVTQELDLISSLSVAENLYFDRLPARWGWIDRGRLHRDAARDLLAVGLQALDPAARTGDLGLGEQQQVEIARALARSCRVLVLDEPTAALTAPQVERLFAHVARIRAEGTAVLYISHRLEEVAAVADRVTVLRDGRVAASGGRGELSPAAMVRAMAGRALAAGAPREPRRHGEVALEVRGLRSGRLSDLSFVVRRGEILGLSGLAGSGRTEILRAIFGADPVERGSVLLDGEELELTRAGTAGAVRAGMGLVPEDRKQQALLLGQPVRVNLTLAALPRLRRAGALLDLDAERRLALEVVSTLDVRCSSLEQPAVELSGGNQQKLAIGRWLLRDVEVLLLDEPTRGVDVVARREVHRLLDELARRGKALVVVSSDASELDELCDRIAVVAGGQLVRVFARGEWTDEALLAAAMGAEEREPDARAGVDA